MKYDEKYADKMKYQIHGFQQRKLLDSGLSNDDALLLRVILDMYSSAKNEFIIENDDKYLWISYTYIQKVIPIIGSKSNIMSKIKKYAELKLIDRILKFERKGEKGSWAYIKPLKGLDELTEYENEENESKENDPIQNLDRGVQNLDRGCTEFGQGVSKIKTGGIQNLDNKDLSSIYTSSNDLSNKDTSSNKDYSSELKNESEDQKTSPVESDDSTNNSENIENVSDKPKKTKKKTKIYNLESQELKAAKYLFSLMVLNDPKAKVPDFQRWAYHIDLLVRVDERTFVEVKKVMDWCQNDGFWKGNILSTKKLREQFSRLLILSEGGNNNNRGHNINNNFNEFKEALKELKEESEQGKQGLEEMEVFEI